MTPPDIYKLQTRVREGRALLTKKQDEMDKLLDDSMLIRGLCWEELTGEQADKLDALPEVRMSRS